LGDSFIVCHKYVLYVNKGRQNLSIEENLKLLIWDPE